LWGGFFSGSGGLDCLSISVVIVYQRPMIASAKLLSCVLAVALSSTGWARIGETLEECIARYGEFSPNPDANDVFVFHDPEVGVYYFNKSGIKITVEIHNGRASRIQFASEQGVALDNDIMNGLLEANAVDGAWQRLPTLSDEVPSPEDARSAAVEQGSSEAQAAMAEQSVQALTQAMDMLSAMGFGGSPGLQWESEGKRLLATKSVLGLTIATKDYEAWMKGRTEQKIDNLRREKLQGIEGF